MVTEDLTTDGSWSQSSISRFLQRAETLLRSTFNPSLKWLFPGCSQDEEEEEGNFVVAHNLVSRSSARLLRLQQALLTVAPQWQLVGWAQMGSSQVCFKGIPAEGSVLHLPSSSLLQGNHRALWRLLEQRALLLFIHEYTRRARLAAAYISRVSHLLEDHLKKSHLTLNQTPSSWSSNSVGLGSLSQELRVHLNHWSCLFSKVHSDHYLRPALVQETRLLVEIKQTLDLLGLQALVLMEHYVYAILSAIAQTELHSVPREVLEDILAGTNIYNQAVGEGPQHSTTQLRTAVLQQAHYSSFCLSTSKGHHPAAFSVKELMMILAVHHADMAAKQLNCWISDQSYHICQVRQRSEWSWEQLQRTNFISSPLQSSCCYTCHGTPPIHIPDLHLENLHPILAKPTFIQHRREDSNKDQTSQCQKYISQTGLERQASLENCKLLQTISPPSATFHHFSALPFSGVCQQDHSSVELLFQLLVSSSDLLDPLASHAPTPMSEAPTEQLLPNTITDVLSSNGKTLFVCSGFQRSGDPDKAETVGAEGTTVESDCHHCPHSVQWLDLGQSLVFADLFGQYRTLLWTFCSKALWLRLHVPQAGNTTGSINLQDIRMGFEILHRISEASKTDLVPKECRTMMDNLSLYLLAVKAHAQWDYVVCQSLGSALKDKCLTDVNQGSNSVIPSSEHDGSVVMSVTMERFLLLSPPLLSSLCSHHSNNRDSGSFSLLPFSLTVQRQTVSMALATAQLSTVWVMSKAYQFLSSWSLNKFLLITQGDLKVLRESLEMVVHQTKSLMKNADSDHHSTLHNHNQLLLRQQLGALDRTVSMLQIFSSLMLKTFSSDCKRMSVKIFEQTMPSAVHWRPSLRTDFPSSPSEYASLAAQTVIGQVLESVAPLSDDARVQALSITMTAFMEAWMEHILKQKIKFSVRGALQLKQDFDSIRELIQSEKYGLSAELHQRLLSLRVFQQVDSAVLCLLQQPQAKPYLHSRAWEPFTHCCSANISRDSTEAVVGSSTTDLRYMEGDDLTQLDPSVVNTDLPLADQSTEPYLTPSLALGAAQQEWLDLRIHSSACRWRLLGLQCLSKSEP